MKMISSTSITSTMGVTLMSETTGGATIFFITAPQFEPVKRPRKNRDLIRHQSHPAPPV
jgi:hypothetical protein